MSVSMGDVEHIDDGRAVGAFCESEMSEHRAVCGVSLFGDCGLCM
jgi:hypothetical protein